MNNFLLVLSTLHQTKKNSLISIDDKIVNDSRSILENIFVYKSKHIFDAHEDKYHVERIYIKLKMSD